MSLARLFHAAIPTWKAGEQVRSSTNDHHSDTDEKSVISSTARAYRPFEPSEPHPSIVRNWAKPPYCSQHPTQMQESATYLRRDVFAKRQVLESKIRVDHDCRTDRMGDERFLAGLEVGDLARDGRGADG